MKIKILIITLVLTLMMSTMAFADVDGEFILIGGDEYISTNALDNMGINSSIVNDEVVFSDSLRFKIGNGAFVEGGKTFVPFKSIMEAFEYGFNYDTIDKMVVTKDNETINYGVTKRPHNDVVVCTIIDEYKYDDKKEENKTHYQKNEVIENTYDSMIYFTIDEMIYVDANGLKSLSLEVSELENGYIVKSHKTETTHELGVKEVYQVYQNGQLIKLVPVEEVLEAFEMSFEKAEKKLVVNYDDQIVVFYE